MSSPEVLQSLNDKKEQLATRISAIEADFKKGRSADFAEQTTESENDEVLDEIHHEAKLELQQIEQAISRFENGLYGLCERCDEPINEKRLAVLPYTSVCINCAQ